MTRRFGGTLALVARPGRERALVEISCATKKRAEELVREFGGSVEKLRPDWLQQFTRQLRTKPLRIGSRLVILSAPSRQTVAARTLVVPAGAAFGTGAHATTAMCLRLLERVSRHLAIGWRMLDAGTGSGILAMAGSRFGAGDVLAIDHDPLACATAKRNASANGIRHIEITTGDILKQDLTGKYDVISANLFSEILIRGMPIWVAHLSANGRLILSGVLRTQEGEVVRALHKRGWATEEIQRRGKWIALLACPVRKRA